MTITLTGANDTPVASVEAGDDVTETLAEAETAITANGSFTVSDVDITDEVTVKSITVATSDNDAGAPGDTALLDMMTLTPDVAGAIINGASTTGSVSWAFDSGADQFDYLAVGEQLTLTYTVTVIDDESAEDTLDIVITITGTNDMPVITAGDVSENLDESETAIQANGSFDVEDVDISDEITVSGITVAKTGIVSHAPSNAALLTMFSTTPGVAGSAIDNASTTGTVNWTFNSGADQFDYLAVGQQLTITYTVTVDDGNGATDTQDVTIVLTGTNDEPFVNTPDATRDLDESETAITASGTFNVGDVDVADTVTLNGITVVTSGVDGGAPANGALLAMFSITDPPTATVIGNTTTVGSVDWAFDSGADQFDYLADGEVLTLTYTLEVIDNHGATADHVVTINVTGTNDAPVVTAGGTLAWENGDGAKPIDGALTVSDVDSPMLIGGTVTITQGHDANDVLGFTTQNGISGSYNAGTGVLTLTGTATVEHYEDALRSVTFNTSGSPPSGANREVTFVVNDGDDDSVAATSTVTVSPAPPVTHNQIVGTENADTSLLGTAGSDIIFGMGGDDIINGGDADDIIIGGLGADNLTGGAGSDIFVFDDLLSVDTVLDFNLAEDLIDLDALLTGAPGTPGNDVTFRELATDEVSLFVNDTQVAELGDLNNGNTVNVIYDQAEASVPVLVAIV